LLDRREPRLNSAVSTRKSPQDCPIKLIDLKHAAWSLESNRGIAATALRL